DSYFSIYGCTDDNDFIKNLYECEENPINTELNIEKQILDLYFKKGSLQPRHRQLSNIKTELSEFEQKDVSRTLHFLQTEGLIQFNGDLSFLTRNEISYYSDNYENT